MKMFRHISLILVVAALAGCAKTEFVPTIPEKEVTFAVGSYLPDTKISSLNGSEDAITSFNSKGFLHAEGINTTQDFFGASGETINFNGTNEWQPSHVYYWPKSSNSHINFVSWYDKNGTPDNVASVSETAISWTIDGTTRTLQADDNIMIADEAWHYNDNATVYTSYSGVVAGVPTLFHHQMAKVNVVVKASKLSDNGTTWTITASNFTLGGVYTAGTLSLTNEEPETLPGTSAWTGSWVTSGSRSTLNGVSAATTVNTTGVQMFSHSMIPQNVGISYISFTYVVRTSYDANNYIEETVNTGNIRLSSFIGAVTSWDMNKKITYTVTINPECNEILIDPQATDWGDTLAPPPISIE